MARAQVISEYASTTNGAFQVLRHLYSRIPRDRSARHLVSSRTGNGAPRVIPSLLVRFGRYGQTPRKNRESLNATIDGCKHENGQNLLKIQR